MESRSEAPEAIEPSTTVRAPMPRGLKITLAGATVAGCAYLALVDPNPKGALYPGCPFRALTGFDCPGCGITRALHALLTGNPLRAFDHNALVMTIVVITAVWLAVNAVRRRMARPPLRVELTTRMAWGLGAVVVAFWLLRNLPWSPFTWLASGASGV